MPRRRPAARSVRTPRPPGPGTPSREGVVRSRVRCRPCAGDSGDLATGAGQLLVGPDAEVGLRFVPQRTARPPVPKRVHLHLTSRTPDHQQRTVARALDLGAAHLDVGQRPEEGHIVLAEPEGNEFRVTTG